MSFLEEHPECCRMDLVSWTLGNYDYGQDRKIYIDPDHPARSITANGARCIVRKLVSGFKAMGLQPGDCVCLHAFNDIMYSMLFLGILGAGGRFTGSNPAYTSAELSHHVRITKARFLISEPELLPRIAPAIQECSLSVSDVFVFDPTGRDFPLYYRSWKDLMDHGESDWVRFERHDESKDTTAALLSTSGTTGFPKAAMISHYSCIIQNIMLNDSKNKPYKLSRILTLPEFHAFAFPIAHVAPLREGITTYIMRRFDLFRYFSAIQQYEITETPMVPQMLRTIVEQPELARKMLTSLRLIWSAGAPLTETLQDEFYRLLKPAARVTQVWGMTEAGWISTFLWPEKDHTGSVGRILPGMESKLMHDDGYEIDIDEISAEIFVRGPTIMQGYLGNSSASKDAFDAGGWLRTGDIAYKHQGKLYIVDRKKEMIKVRGWQVSPAELEAALLLHPDISDAAVVGIRLRHNDETELPRAYVVKKPGSDLSEHEVKLFMALRVARYKNLDAGVAFIDTIPRSSAGKILKGRLKDQAAAETCDAYDKIERNPSVSTVLATKQSSETGTISLGSSVTSYDGTNETGSQSRRNSTSTAGTIHSEATGRTSRSVRVPTSTKDDLKYRDKPAKAPAAIDLCPDDETAGDLRSRIENAVAERGKCMSDAGASRCLSNSSSSDSKDLRTSQSVAQVPVLSEEGSSLLEILAPFSHHMAAPDLKKRTADKTEENKANSKKLKVDVKTIPSNSTTEEPYRRAMALVMKDSEAQPD